MLAAAMIVMGAGFSGCSDRSRLVMLINGIVGTVAPNVNKSYLEVDTIGSLTAPCTPIQDPVRVTVGVDAPGTVGPSFNAWVTGFQVDYYYYDPNDGTLHGPVSGLSISAANLHERVVEGGTVDIEIPVVSFNVKAWSQRVGCASVPGFGGPGTISRMIGRITMSGVDYTNKKLSAQGDILIYLYDYAPGPVLPSSPSDTTNWCFFSTPQSYWASICH